MGNSKSSRRSCKRNSKRSDKWNSKSTRSPTKEIPGGPVEGIPSQSWGPTCGIPAPGPAARETQGIGVGDKWCIGKKDIKKGLLKKSFVKLCKEVDCSSTRPKRLCYDESM